MQEPSVLDFVKAKLTFWKKSDLHIPPPDDEGLAVNLPEDEPAEAGLQPDNVQAAPLESATRLPWFTLGGLFLALIAMLLMEPPDKKGWIAAGLFLFSAVLITLALIRYELKVGDIPYSKERFDDLSVRWISAFTGAALTLLAFWLFNRNRFNLLNVTIWAMAIFSFVRAFWKSDGQFSFSAWIEGLRAKVQTSPKITLRVTLFGLLMVEVLLIIAFFRFYNLDTLPGEMVSDHAEKLLDVVDVTLGKTSIFFERNTGREAFQFYWTALIGDVFKTGISFMSLKLGTVIVGLITLLFIYRLGKMLGGRWVGLFALFFAGIAYWPNIISRIGLRFPLYPFCVAPVMFYLIRGLREGRRNDFIWAGLWLGLGLHGYTSSRIVPLLILVAIGLYALHAQHSGMKRQALWGLLVIGLISFVVFTPLARYALENPNMFAFRSLTRLGSAERPLPGPAGEIFISNLWNAVSMFFNSNGDVWVHSVPYRPALDMVTGALFFAGLIMLLVRYVRFRRWEDLLLLVSIPILLLPSVLSLAFPNENPNLNRTAGAYVPVFLIIAIAFDGLLRTLRGATTNTAGVRWSWVIGGLLAVWALFSNYDLFFNQYATQYRQAAWNTREMGEVIRDFSSSVGSIDTAWVVGYPYWVDTRLVGINAGVPTRDTQITPDQFSQTVNENRSKLFILNLEDVKNMSALSALYPEGRLIFHASPVGKDFMLFLVAPTNDLIP